MNTPPDNTPEFTPIERHGDIWLKRDDLYRYAGICGGKVRACRKLATEHHPETGEPPIGLVTASARKSPQMQIVSRIAARLGVPCRCHTASGAYTPEMQDAVRHGAELVQHRPGYNSVICSRAEADASALRWRYIPFGMEHPTAMQCTTDQVAGLRQHFATEAVLPARIVITIGSGMSAAGLLRGLLNLAEFRSIPVLGVMIGASPIKRLDKYAPAWWRQRMKVIDATKKHAYASHVDAMLGGVVMDPHYEAKAVEYVEPGDLFWVIGIRAEVHNESE